MDEPSSVQVATYWVNVARLLVLGILVAASWWRGPVWLAVGLTVLWLVGVGFAIGGGVVLYQMRKR